MIKEDFLHYVWKLKKFDFLNLLSTEGKPILVHDTGFHNTHAGPDFLQARITVDDILWVGSVEMHLRSSDWYKHHHQDDPAYNNVILHVVLEDDAVIRDSLGVKIPCLELKKRIYPGDIRNYHLLQFDNHWIPCAPQTAGLPPVVVYQAVEKAMIARILRKTHSISILLEQYDNNWDQVFLILLFRYFGTNINSEAFEMLAKSIPMKLLAKQKDRPEMIEAVLFGQSGLLNERFMDLYPITLRQDYAFLQNKYNLKPIPAAAWKFLRLRPDNFPTIRIAQLAAVLYQNDRLFSRLVHETDIDKILSIFAVKPAEYWATRYVFGRESGLKLKVPGKGFLLILAINVIAPIKYIYGEKTNNNALKQSALNLLEQIPAEENHIISQWKELDIRPQNAFESQGLIELKKSFCSIKKCLECPIGHYLMKGTLSE